MVVAPLISPCSAHLTMAPTSHPRIQQNVISNTWSAAPERTREQALEFPGSAAAPWARYVHDPDARGIGTVRWPRIVPKDNGCAVHLAKRTLTNLYNQRPAWLANAHAALDQAISGAERRATGSQMPPPRFVPSGLVSP